MQPDQQVLARLPLLWRATTMNKPFCYFVSTKAGVPMPLETLVPPSSISDSAAPIAVPAPVTVAAVLAAIVVDAASAAGEYLRDTEVPHGGE